jgi:hypothetical protein
MLAMKRPCHTNQQTTFGVHRTSDMSENIFDKIIGPVMYDLSHLVTDKMRDSWIDDNVETVYLHNIRLDP